MSELKVKHDTAMHDCDDDTQGPIVPVDGGTPPHLAQQVAWVKCAACGHAWREVDNTVLARVWWSQGAWDAEEAQDE